jgi:hypothetical protein
MRTSFAAAIVFVSLLPACGCTDRAAIDAETAADTVTHSIGRRDDGPAAKHGFSNAPWNYYVCKRCNSVEGGCFMKNSVDAIRTADAANCGHEWTLVSATEYLDHCSRHFPNVRLNYRPK